MSDKRFKLSKEAVLQYKIMEDYIDIDEYKIVELLNKLLEEKEYYHQMYENLWEAIEYTFNDLNGTEEQFLGHLLWTNVGKIRQAKRFKNE